MTEGRVPERGPFCIEDGSAQQKVLVGETGAGGPVTLARAPVHEVTVRSFRDHQPNLAARSF